MKVHLQPQKDYWDKLAHTDHPARHWDRTCPACLHEETEKLKEKLARSEAMLKEPTKLMLIPELMKQAGWVRKQKPLTEEQIKSFLSEAVRLPSGWLDFARAVERAHGITNDPN